MGACHLIQGWKFYSELLANRGLEDA